jgi:outer membrane protein assembly factor BamB
MLQTLPLHAADWPMWRHDVGRTAATDGKLPAELKLIWTRGLLPNSTAYKDKRLQFDRGYEPIVLGKRMFVASARDNSVMAIDTETGVELWQFFADGPIRFAPVAGQGRVLFGSDDGYFYCVKASSGELVWKFKAVPSDRRVLGNSRLISVWPVRGGPVLKDDKVYFAAGVWPLEGVFVYCLDAATGKVVWLNDSTSYLYGDHPHGTEGFGGLAPQGYLLIDGEDLIVPCSNAYPAYFDLATGKLKSFKLPSAGRKPGGWFASTPAEKERDKLKRRGLLFDNEVNAKRHEDKPRSEGLPAIRSTISANDRDFKFSDGLQSVEGEIYTMLAADNKLFAVTVQGAIYCFGQRDIDGIRNFLREKPQDVKSKLADEIVQATGARYGYAIVLGIDDPQFLFGLVSNSELRVVAVDSDQKNLTTLRRESRVPAERLSLRLGDPLDYELPQYFASLIVVNKQPDAKTLSRLYQSLRPYGGCLVVRDSMLPDSLVKGSQLPGSKIDSRPQGWKTITRAGSLKGAANYLGDWKPTSDDLVKAPLGVLWFDDSVSHFKRSPQPAFIDGVMVSVDKDWTDATHRKGGKDYKLLEPMLSDVYTGRVFTSGESAAIRERVKEIAAKTVVDRETVQPSKYNPPGPKPSRAGYAFAGTRTNPLTGLKEARIFPKRYGCDGGVDYGALFTMRSATAAFYDKRTESGTINISGPRSGCTNSIIPANGLLNVPYFYEGCTCSYPLPMAVSLTSMPEEFEQWTSWGEVPFATLDGKIKRLGLNLGAPGDRKTDDGTLWLNHPDVGGPSPKLSITTKPETPEFFYRHSLFMNGGDGWPWVTASGARGLRSITIKGIKPGSYSVSLLFSAPDKKECSFSVSINGQERLKNVQPLGDAGIPMQGSKRLIQNVEVSGPITIELTPIKGTTVLCGVELIATNQ